jgi:hypothetical protein
VGATRKKKKLLNIGVNDGLKAKDRALIRAAEMKYMQLMSKYTWMPYKRNYDIPRELKIRPILDSILKYTTIWMKYFDRTERNKFPNYKNYKLYGLQN